jgi:hypothetical protein
MSLSLFASVLCTALPSITPLELPALRRDGEIAAQVGVHVTPTALVARNFSSAPQLFVFTDEQSGRRALRTLGAGRSFEFRFSRETLEAVALEIVCVEDGAWHATGAIELDAVLRRGSETLWIQHDTGARSTTWSQRGAEVTLADAGPSALPEDLQGDLQGDHGRDAGGPASTNPTCAPAHVPVVTPSDRPNGGLPPKLEERPLPPV